MNVYFQTIFAILLMGTLPCASAFERNPSFVGRSEPIQIRLSELVSAPNEPERFEEIRDEAKKGIQIEESVKEKGSSTRVLSYTLSNTTKAPLFIKLSVEAVVPFKEWQWWNGYTNQISTRFEGENLLSSWFPVNAAIGDGSAFLLGLNPMEVYSRVESTKDPSNGALSLAIPLILEPGSRRTVSFVLSKCAARYGYRDVVQHYYDLFPEAYQPAPGIHPSVLSSQSRYLFWKPESYRQPLSEDMLRRFTGGAGGWEWCYGPFLRGGDWAISDEWSVGFRNYTKERVDARRAELKERFDTASGRDVAAMYYLNVLWAEKSLMNEHFPEVLWNPKEAKSWGMETVFGLYPWKNRYADLFVRSIEAIAKEYPSTRGIGWDSCFGHLRIPDSVAGVKETVEKSYQDGNVFALNGVAYTHLLDLNRSLESDGYRRANAVNLKLVAPYFLGVRSDSALYEGTPVEDPRRLIRMELLRARLGSPKALTWHKHLTPSRTPWVNWASLSDEEALETYRQLHDDVLLLSYYWGGIPSPGMPTLGIERTFKAVPELIALVRQGWQPSPAIDHPEDLLVARYGKGAGARLALINPHFEPRKAEFFLPAEYWDGKIPFLVRQDGEPLRSNITAEGTRVTVEVRARQVTMLHVLGEAAPERFGKESVEIVSSGKAEPGLPAEWKFTVNGPDSGTWKGRFVLDESHAAASVEGKGATGKWSGNTLDFSLSPDANASFSVEATPAVLSNVNFSQLQAMEWFPKDGRPGIGVVTKGDSLASEASRIDAWFNGYSSVRLNAPYTPERLPAKAEGRVNLLLELQPNLTGTGKIELKDGTLVIAAADSGKLKETVLFFLREMDRAFPDYGVIPPLKEPELQRINLLSNVLTPEPKSSFIFKPTLAERMKKSFPPLEVVKTKSVAAE